MTEDYGQTITGVGSPEELNGLLDRGNNGKNKSIYCSASEHKWCIMVQIELYRRNTGHFIGPQPPR